MPIRLQFPQRLDGERKLTPDRRILVLDDRTVEIYRYYHLFNSQFSILMRGLVIKNTGSWYTVRTEDGRDIESKIKGNFRLKDIKSTNPVAVGDRVVIDINKERNRFYYRDRGA